MNTENIRGRINENLCIYSLRHKSEKPLYSIDFLFNRVNGQLEWQMFNEVIRSGCPMGKDDLTLYANIDDFIENRKVFLSQVGLSYQYEIIETIPKMKTGEFYPNIYRPVFSFKLQRCHLIHDGFPFGDVYDDLYIIDRDEYDDFIRQLEIIIDELLDVFKVIAPTPNNFNCYGHAIRNIIFLACTEIDSMMKNALVKNGYCKESAYCSIIDYRILNEALRLSEYELKFTDFDSIGTIRPFEEWINKDGKISWYSDYNDIKHRRYECYEEANLRNAIYAILGYAAVMVSQYGKENNLWNRKLGKIIKITNEPKWKLEEFYIPFTTDIAPQEKKFVFSRTKKQKSETMLQLSKLQNKLKDKRPKEEVLQEIDRLRNLISERYE